MSNHAEPTLTVSDDRDRLIDNPFNIGPYDRSTKAGEWWVITGLHVRLPDDLTNRPEGTSKLLVFAETISVGKPGGTQINVNDLSDVLLIGVNINQHSGSTFHRDMPAGSRTDEFRIAVFGKNISPPESRWSITTLGFPEPQRFDLGDGRQPVRTEITMRLVERNSPLMPGEWNRIHSRIPIVDARQSPLSISGPGFDACLEFLARMLLTAQFLFDEQRSEEADDLLDRLETLLAINPELASWQGLALQCVVTREMLQPQLPGLNRVPTLSPTVYRDVAKSYVPALRAFADAFQHFVDRTFDVTQRRAAATLMLNRENNAIRFQGLVTEQLTSNYQAAERNLLSAETALTAQNARIEEADQVFQQGLSDWQRQQESQAGWAIAGVVLSAVASFAKIAAGKPADLAALAAKAEQVRRIGQIIAKIVRLVERIQKLIKAIPPLVKAIRQLITLSGRITNAGQFAARMAEVRSGARSELDGAPSESAYWDQFWVQCETALAPAIDANVNGAREYLAQLKILIIYGRELTSAQAALLPIAQELAQANLLTEIARSQREDINRQIQTLQSGPAPSAMAASLWIRHRSVRRSVFAALQDFNAAFRFWALKEPLSTQTPGQAISDLVSELNAIGDIEASFRSAFESFYPRPQDFVEDFDVPAEAVADLLREGRFALNITPDFGPVQDLGNIGRVRVSEVRVWLKWNEEKRPQGKLVEFTVRTNGEYYDQRFESDEVKPFHFIMDRVNQTFRYDPARATNDPAAIRTPARVANNFAEYYPQPTLFTEWRFSLPNTTNASTMSLEDLQGAVEGIKLEFIGEFIKDPNRFV